MLRFTSNPPALIEAHVQAEEARHALEREIERDFAILRDLNLRLQAFDHRLEDARRYLRSEISIDDERIHSHTM
jgi:hypothetical protein